MAINVRCPVCKKSFKIGASRCSCGNNLKTNCKFKVVVKMPTGQIKSKQCDTLEMARKVEGKFRADTVHIDVFDHHEAPSIKDAWKKYLRWAKRNKRSWKDDETRWNNHVAGHVGTKRMNKIMPKDIQRILDDMSMKLNPKGQPYAPATIKQVLVLIKRVYNWSIKTNLYYGVVNNLDNRSINLNEFADNSDW